MCEREKNHPKSYEYLKETRNWLSDDAEGKKLINSEGKLV